MMGGKEGGKEGKEEKVFSVMLWFSKHLKVEMVKVNLGNVSIEKD